MELAAASTLTVATLDQPTLAALRALAATGQVLLVRAQLRLDAGDAQGARVDIDRAEGAFATDVSDQSAQQRRARQLRQQLAASHGIDALESRPAPPAAHAVET